MKFSAPLSMLRSSDRLVIIGLGLIGSSTVARGRDGASQRERSSRRTPIRRSLQRVIELKLADEIASTPAGAVGNADLVILCVPVGANGAVAEEIGPHLKAGAVISDVGSVKAAVVAAIAPHLPPGVALVPAHPVAGTEQSGPDAGFETLFLHRWWHG